MHFPEQFLHFIWRFQRYAGRPLYCVDGQKLQVLSPGLLNSHAGPDFSEAKLIIGSTHWVGHVEIHIRSSDWYQHGHQENAYYESVILHVVYEDDRPVLRADGTAIPTFELKERFPSALLDHYQTLIGSIHDFPCQPQIGQVDPFLVNAFLSRLLPERLQQKSKEVFSQLQKNHGNWEDTFFYFIARNFGFKVNVIPFEMLASSIPSQLFAKHRDRPLQIEALIFGQAGFLDEKPAGAYPEALRREYDFLRHKYNLNPIAVSLWKFLRMRPQNFPTIRLAQFAALLQQSDRLFSRILEQEQLSGLYFLFEKLPVTTYWKGHYHFQKQSKGHSLQLGRESLHNILINTVCLLLFCYGQYTGQQEYSDRALTFLEQIPAERNSIITRYQAAGVQLDNAFYSQALLQLNKNYCNGKKCLNCGIGIKILNK